MPTMSTGYLFSLEILVLCIMAENMTLEVETEII